MWFLSPNGGARFYLGKPAVIWGKSSTLWPISKECRIIEGHLMPAHVHMCTDMPPKHPVASVMGFPKGKSAIARQLCGKERNFTGQPLRARGYAVSTVGFELEQVRQYIRDQEEADGSGGQF